MMGVHCVPSHHRQGATPHGSRYQLGANTAAGERSARAVGCVTTDPSGFAFYDHRVDHMVVPRLTPAVPQRRQVVDDVGDQEDDVEDNGDGVASDAAPEPD